MNHFVHFFFHFLLDLASHYFIDWNQWRQIQTSSMVASRNIPERFVSMSELGATTEDIVAKGSSCRARPWRRSTSVLDELGHGKEARASMAGSTWAKPRRCTNTSFHSKSSDAMARRRSLNRSEVRVWLLSDRAGLNQSNGVRAWRRSLRPRRLSELVMVAEIWAFYYGGWKFEMWGYFERNFQGKIRHLRSPHG